MKILVCDDKQLECDKTVHAIESRGEVTGLAGHELAQALKSFFGSVDTALNGDATQYEQGLGGEFSGFDLVIVDNNLSALNLDGARLTAETIIGYLRAFSDISYIVSLNKNPHVDFDLRYLFGDYQSLADIALNMPHLSNGWLWEEEATGFSPWYWPRLHDAVQRRNDQVEFLIEHMQDSIWNALQFPDGAQEYLSLRAMSALLSSGDDLTEVAFEALLDSCRALAPAEISRVRQLADNGVDFARRSVRRITAYEVDRFVRRDLLGVQDVLVDLPHLVAQMPFLLGERSSEVDYWNEVLRFESAPFGLDEQLFEAHLASTLFSRHIWVPKPCFWWPSIKSDEQLLKHFFAAEGNWPNAVFCEDLSRFVLVSETGGSGSPQEFESEIPGSWPTRYIGVVADYEYTPRSRILGSAV